MTRRIMAPALLCLAALFLAGCGRTGKPERPEGAVYPLFYPSASVTDTSRKTHPVADSRIFVDPSIDYLQMQLPDTDLGLLESGNNVRSGSNGAPTNDSDPYGRSSSSGISR